MTHIGKIRVLVLIVGLVGTLTACQSGETRATRTTSSRATTTSSSPAKTSPAKTSPAPSPAATTPASPSSSATGLVLGPDGFGSLKMGMSRADAEATGETQPFRNEPMGATCTWRAWLKGAPNDQANEGMVLYSETLGIASISAYPGVRTPEGITIGSSLADVKKAYPGLNQAVGSRDYAQVPGQSQLLYRIGMYGDAVGELTLQYARQDCYE